MTTDVLKKELADLYKTIDPKKGDWVDGIAFAINQSSKQFVYWIPTLENVQQIWSAEPEKKPELQKLSQILGRLRKEEYSNWCSELQRDSAKLQKNKEFCKALQNPIYRILELTRLGKKEDVMYMLVRIFTAQQQAFPKSLSRAAQLQGPSGLKTFQALVYTFLSYFTGTKVNKED